MEELTQTLRELVAAKFNVPIDRVRPETDFVGDLGADSLDVVEIVMALEDRMGVQIEDAEAEAVRTVGDAVALLAAKRAA